MCALRVLRVYRVGPRKVARLSKGAVGIYLPVKLNFLAGKTVMVTIEVLEEENNAWYGPM